MASAFALPASASAASCRQSRLGLNERAHRHRVLKQRRRSGRKRRLSWTSAVSIGTAQPAMGEHLRWLKRELKPGDVITINIVETESWDEPSTRTPYVSKDETERERQYYLRLKRKFEASDTT